MVVIWDKRAKADLKEYMAHSMIHTVKEYVQELVQYTDALANYPNLGKIQYIYHNVEVRQLVFKMHKIFYYIKDDKVIVLAAFHTAIDINKITRYLRGLTY